MGPPLFGELDLISVTLYVIPLASMVDGIIKGPRTLSLVPRMAILLLSKTR